MIYSFTTDSPVGALTLCADDEFITELYFGDDGKTEPNGLILKAVQELDEYFSGSRRSFDLPLSPQGTEFQRRVWKALCDIPYGDTRTYGEIAAAVGNGRACRAVGMANNRNPIAILIPCHRVIGADGKLTGYAGGLQTKEFLLCLEHKNT